MQDLIGHFPVEQNIELLDAVIWDLDGTLACGKHRLHLLPKKEDAGEDSAWTAFSMACMDDDPIVDNITLCNVLSKSYTTIILTGRGAVSEELTKEWLEKHGVNYDYLLMRSIGDCRKDTELKEGVINMLKRDYNIICCFDDLEHVAKHIRSLGITCHLVTHYDTMTVAQESNGEE